jgi:hypothetical protein
MRMIPGPWLKSATEGDHQSCEHDGNKDDIPHSFIIVPSKLIYKPMVLISVICLSVKFSS